MCASRKADLSTKRSFSNFFFKLRPGVRVGGDTLKKCQGVTNSVALVGCEHLQLVGLVQLETVIQMLVGK